MKGETLELFRLRSKHEIKSHKLIFSLYDLRRPVRGRPILISMFLPIIQEYVMTNKFAKRSGQESIKHQRLFLKRSMECANEACQNTPNRIHSALEWDDLAQVVMATNCYQSTSKVGGVRFNKALLDPMMVWMTIGQNHPSGSTRTEFLDRAKEHAELQYHSITAHFFPQNLDHSEALLAIQQVFTEVASDWGLCSILSQLPWFQSDIAPQKVTQFLKSVLGVVGRMKKGRAGEELDNGNEFILRAEGWQQECITAWLLIHCTENQVQINGDSIFDHIYSQNELLAYMVRYYVTGDKKVLRQARQACKLGTAVLLFRFGLDDEDLSKAYKAIEQEFLRGAKRVRSSFNTNLQGLINIDDWYSEYLEKRVFGALRIVPEFTHTAPKRHLYKVNKNFLLDKIRQFCNRIDVEESEVRRRSFDDDRADASIDHEDTWSLGPGEDWTDAEYMQNVNDALESGIPNIRHRFAFLFKHVWGTVAVKWDIPEAWTTAFQARLRYATTKEVTDLFDALLVTQAELGMNKSQYRIYRDDIKAQLFQSNAETVERYFRIGRNAINEWRLR